jgi:multidrug efflux pump subunit AcrB
LRVNRLLICSKNTNGAIPRREERPGRQRGAGVFQVYTQALPDYRASANDIRNLRVKAGNGTMTPIGAVAEIKEVHGPLLISLYNLYPSASVVGRGAPGFSSGEALDIMDQIGALTVLGAANDLYTQIGLVLLIAIGSKSAILVVEYARQRRAEGMEIVPAAVDGARLRFRPILMTSFAFILGVFPLVIATGAGVGARRSIGLAVFSGMIASTCLVVVFVPSFYVVM